MSGSRATVVVVTGTHDPTADAVIAELERRDANVHRLDLGDFPLQARLTAIHDGREWSGTIRVDGSAPIEIDSVTSIYYRRPTRFRFAPQMADSDRAYAEAEARIGVGGVMAALRCRWVSHPHNVARAEWKPLQLQVASDAGLAVPRTLISNDVAAGRDFISSATSQVVCKTLSPTLFVEDGSYKVTYTTVVDSLSLNREAFEATTHLLQEWVPKAYEARVTVVGNQILAVGIAADSERSCIDWRADYDNIRYTPIEVPDEVGAGIHAYLGEFGLPFGAFDFVITPDDQWIMLECNPNGQWLWLHYMAGLPIPAALADLLTGEQKTPQEGVDHGYV